MEKKRALLRHCTRMGKSGPLSSEKAGHGVSTWNEMAAEPIYDGIMDVNPIDEIMERASVLLGEMAYSEAEKLCVEALGKAKAVGDFDRYARILLPLQETRRLRRQGAVETGTFLVTEKMEVEALLERYPAGCLFLVGDIYGEDEVTKVRKAAFDRGLKVEAMLLNQQDLRAAFEHLMEQRGDAELGRIGRVSTDMTGEERLNALEQCVEAVGDHELAHQRLAEAARALAE